MSEVSSSAQDCHSNYEVIMLGTPGVGKTALTNQFVSEQASEHDDFSDNFIEEKSVSVVLDGEEAELIFIDHPASEHSPEKLIQNFDADAYVVVYSITDRVSFSRAETILSYLQECAFIADKGVILVGNKTDLVRLRVVSTDEGKEMAKTYGCKFIETSNWLNHNVDDLLVGICSQIRLKQQRKERQQQKRDRIHRYKGSRTSLYRSRSIIRDLFKKISSRSKSCDNLLVL